MANGPTISARCPASSVSPPSSGDALQLPDATLTNAVFHVLYLFSGPPREGSFEEACAAIAGRLGIKIVVDGVDLSRGQDLCDQHLWDDCMDKLEADHYDSVLDSPPCTSFCNLKGQDGGPAAVRDVEGPGRYGRPD